MLSLPEADLEDVGGVGGTLAGNPLSLAAVRATLGEVLTDEVWERTIPLAERFAAGVEDVVAEPACRGTSPGSAAAPSTASRRSRLGTAASRRRSPTRSSRTTSTSTLSTVASS